jgi:hypothetical protein
VYNLKWLKLYLLNLSKCTYLDYTSLLLLSPSFLALDKLLSIIRPNTILLSIIFYSSPSKRKEQEIPYLLIDVTYFKVRDKLHYEYQALFLVTGIRNNSYREILGVRLTGIESVLFLDISKIGIFHFKRLLLWFCGIRTT